LDDPDGKQDKGKGGGKVIDVFLSFPQADQKTRGEIQRIIDRQTEGSVLRLECTENKNPPRIMLHGHRSLACPSYIRCRRIFLRHYHLCRLTTAHRERPQQGAARCCSIAAVVRS
jgi:hypothetical protein